MDPRDLQTIADNAIAQQTSDDGKIGAETVIAYIDEQLLNAAEAGKTHIELSYTYQPMKKYHEDSKIGDDVDVHFSGRGFRVRKQTPDNTSPYLDISY